MGGNKLRGKDLRKINYSINSTIAMAIDVMAKRYKHSSIKEKLKLLEQVKINPEDFKEHETLGALARALMPEEKAFTKKEIKILDEPKPFNCFGRKMINENAFDQMQLAMRLPVAEYGALMPDAHHGYGVPIGGVIATKQSVIPYAVGLDIGCRMSLTIYDAKAEYLEHNSYMIKRALKERTNFGTGGKLKFKQDHAVLDRAEFKMTPLLRQLHGKAMQQLGTSGSGNHFVEFGLVQLESGNGVGLDPGEYIGLLAHSGSRGFGATIAKYYTDLAIDNCHLPKNIQHLAWLDINTEAGQEYWLSMNLAGDYAQACHDQIHYNLAKYMGLTPIAKIENHHNFAWKENHEGEDLIVHRKGATPAGKDVLGIIPASMTGTGYIVKGKGNARSMESASHGAGRKMSRKKAKNSYTGSELKKVLKREGVSLIGGGVDEAPIAYKDLDQVMRCQTDLVDIVGSFRPKIVRMDKH